MATYTPIEKDKYYRRNNSVPVNGGMPKPTIHFYPDLTDEVLKANRYEIPFIFTYKDTLNAVKELQDDIHTIQMAFANPETAKTHNCYIHYLDTTNDTQKIALVEFGIGGQLIIREWV